MRIRHHHVQTHTLGFDHSHAEWRLFPAGFVFWRSSRSSACHPCSRRCFPGQYLRGPRDRRKPNTMIFLIATVGCYVVIREQLEHITKAWRTWLRQHQTVAALAPDLMLSILIGQSLIRGQSPKYNWASDCGYYNVPNVKVPNEQSCNRPVASLRSWKNFWLKMKATPLISSTLASAVVFLLMKLAVMAMASLPRNSLRRNPGGGKKKKITRVRGNSWRSTISAHKYGLWN